MFGFEDGREGLALRSSKELFRLLNEKQDSHTFTVHVNVYELYMEKFTDLIKKAEESEEMKKKQEKIYSELKLRMVDKNAGFEVVGVKKKSITGADELISTMKKSIATRSEGKTAMNVASSRSHVFAIVDISSTDKNTGTVTTSKLTLLDLAGTERVNKRYDDSSFDIHHFFSSLHHTQHLHLFL